MGADFWLSSAFGQAIVSANICQDSESLAFLKQPQNFLPLAKISSVVKDSDVILIGEIHYSLPGQRRLILRKLRPYFAGHKACLFYELPAEMPIRAHLEKFKAKNYELVSEEFRELHFAALAFKLGEFTIDGPASASFDAQMSSRNLTMGKNIFDLWQSGKCEKSVLFVGKAHLTEETVETQSLPQILRKVGVPIKVVNLQNAQEQKSNLQTTLASWNGICSSWKKTALPVPTKPVIFESSKLPSRLVFNPRSEDLEPWTVFDWTILTK